MSIEYNKYAHVSQEISFDFCAKGQDVTKKWKMPFHRNRRLREKNPRMFFFFFATTAVAVAVVVVIAFDITHTRQTLRHIDLHTPVDERACIF